MESNFGPIHRAGIFFSPGRIIFGAGCSKQAGATAKSFNATKALIIAGPVVTKTGSADGILAGLESENITVETYEREGSEPTSTGIDECAAFARKGGFDLIIGLGGGSSLDTAKIVAVLATNEGSVRQYMGRPDAFPKRGLPKILIPTTAGSGAEVTMAGGLLDDTTKTKAGIISRFCLPEATILDPLLTLTVPPRFTAETAMDAFVHAMEGYVSRVATPFTEVFAPEVFRLVYENLPVAYQNGQDVGARFNLLMASTMAGLGGGIAAIHGLAFGLEAVCHVPHAKAVCSVLPHVMERSLEGNPEKYARIAKILGQDITGLSVIEAAGKSVGAVRGFLERFGISTKLADCGVSEKDIPALCKDAADQAMWLQLNPKNLTVEDVKSLYFSELI